MKNLNIRKYEHILRQRLAEHGEAALARFEQLTPRHKTDFLRWIVGADRESTRLGRIDKAVAKLCERCDIGQPQALTQ